MRVLSGALDPLLDKASVHGLLDDPLKNSNKEKDHCRSTKDFEKISYSNLSLYRVKNEKKVLVHCTQ